jgi:hypothetical protein
MLSEDVLDDLSRRLIEEVNIYGGEVSRLCDTDRYIACIEKYPEMSGYRHISGAVKGMCSDILRKGNEDALEAFHKLILVLLIRKNLSGLPRERLPEEVERWVVVNFERIVRKVRNSLGSKNFASGVYTYRKDAFRKDLAICSLRLIPTGGPKLEVAALSARFLFRNGLGQLIRGVALVVGELGGIKPLYQMHMDSNDLELLAAYRMDRNAEGARRFYSRVAEMMRMNVEIRGVFGIGWPNDPELRRIDPPHFHGTELATQNGGKLFYVGTSDEDTRDATIVSEHRKRLYEEGKYVPKRYLLVWPRRRLMNWAEKSG